MKFRRLMLTAAAAACFVFTGCQKSVEGDELINKARDEYVKLDSARVVMTNTETDEVEQEFTFKYDEKDTLIFSYYGKNEGKEYALYNDGYNSEMYKDEKYTKLTSDDKDFQKYTREATYPQADKGMILLESNSVKEAEVKEENGGTHVIHVYDADKISADSDQGELKAFTAEYFFNKNGDLDHFTETSVIDKDGKEKTYSYKIEITEKNSVDKVENTAEKYAPAE